MNNYGQTPLSLTVMKVREGAVRTLSEREDLTPNTWYFGTTLLSWAASNGHRGIVKMLLKREDVTPNTANGDGQTPLPVAARDKHSDIVKMLQERGDIAPNTRIKTVERLLRGQPEMGMRAPGGCFLNGKMFLPTLRIQTVEHLSCGLQNTDTL